MDSSDTNADADLTRTWAMLVPVADLLWPAGVRVSPIVHPTQQLRSDQLLARRPFGPVDHSVCGASVHVTYPFRLPDHDGPSTGDRHRPWASTATRSSTTSSASNRTISPLCTRPASTRTFAARLPEALLLRHGLRRVAVVAPRLRSPLRGRCVRRLCRGARRATARPLLFCHLPRTLKEPA